MATSQSSSQQVHNIPYHRVYNQQEINRLQAAFKKTPFLLQEGHIQHPRRACS